MPLLAVIVPARNEESHIASTLDSLLGQSVRPSRIIIVLDRCTDGTERVVDDYARRFKEVTKAVKSSTKYSMKSLKGFFIAETLNVGLASLEHPLPEFIMVANADSTYTERYLQEAIEIFGRHPNCAIVGYPHYANVSGSGYVMRTSFLAQLGCRLVECAAEDTYIQLSALQRGYSIEPIKNERVILLRKRGEGSIKSRLGYAFSKGYGAYTLGYSFHYQCGRAAYWMIKGKLSYFGIVVGFIYAKFKGEGKLDIASTGVVRDWQKTRLKSVFS